MIMIKSVKPKNGNWASKNGIKFIHSNEVYLEMYKYVYYTYIYMYV